MFADPLRRHDCQTVQGRAQSLGHALYPIEGTNRPQPLRRVSPLSPARLEPLALATLLQERIEQEGLGTPLQQATTQLTEDGTIKARIGQL